MIKTLNMYLSRMQSLLAWCAPLEGTSRSAMPQPPLEWMPGLGTSRLEARGP